MNEEILAIAIMERAADDYRAARWRYKYTGALGQPRAAAELKELEDFFKSKRADIYSFGKAVYILEQLKKEKVPKKLERRKWVGKYDKI